MHAAPSPMPLPDRGPALPSCSSICAITRPLDEQGFTAIGKVVTGMDVVDKLYAGYGEMPDMGGQGPDPAKIESQGNEYLTGRFPKLDMIKKATIQ